jgi:hypothetical protein
MWSILTKSFEKATHGYSHTNGHKEREPFLAYQALCDYEQGTQSHNIDDKALEYRSSEQGSLDNIEKFATRLTDGQALLTANNVIITDREVIAIFIKGLDTRHVFLKGFLSAQKANHTPMTTFADVLQSAITYSHNTKGFDNVILAMQSTSSSNSSRSSVSMADDDMCIVHKDCRSPHTNAQCFTQHPDLLAETRANRKRKPQEARYKNC